jgi:phytoene dehydrogenase-like protein
VEPDRFDVIVIGGGPNGLTCAAYLRQAGARVVVLDKRFEWGGTMATDDYSTPFRYNVAQFALPLGARELPPFNDLALGQQAIRLLEPDPVAAFVSAGGGEPFVVGRGGRGLGALEAMFDAVTTAVTPLLFAPPVPVDEVERAIEQGGGGAALELARMTPSEAAARVDDDRARAMVRYLCALAGFPNPDEQLGLMGAFALARLLRPSIAMGGTGTLARAVFRAGARAGAAFRNVADVQHVDASGDGVRAVCRDGRTFDGRTVVCAIDPKAALLDLFDEGGVPEEVRKAVIGWKLDDFGLFVGHFGIKGDAPMSRGAEATAAMMQIVGFDDEAAVAAHLDAATHGRMPASPAGHLTVTTRLDPAQAAPGPYGPLHTLRFETLTPVHPPGEWSRQVTAEYRERCWDLIRRHTSGLDASRRLFAFADSPADLERRFRTMRNGSPRQGRLIREQTFADRPHPDCSAGRTPIPGVYLASGGVHPGIPGTLAGGYNAAVALCEDIPDVLRWWPEPDFVARARKAGTLPTPARA